ncbi:FtsX-like permease family protein [Pontibacter sp. G13]|uniref:ABC transporter permease n=1 Tax=Pontibacter sp. G13 TaxID=3074898 RepID=UPI00288ADD78|nr:FtsX-like permease family protein [Pontibacter sp. G13]WNJ18695.1 FtsX-like permease family protein [Pontibacter sp. G13]
MFKNYFTVAFRNLRKQRFYTLINIGGLAVGIACCLMISLFVLHEMSYDSFHEKKDRIYRLSADMSFGEMQGNMAYMSAPMGPTMALEMPEVENFVRFRQHGSFLVKKEGETESYKEKRVVFVDNTIFEVFDVPIIAGEPAPLAEKDGIAIAESIAQKYYGSPEEALGKTMFLDTKRQGIVRAVYRDFPTNSQMRFEFLLSMEGLSESKEGIWLSHNFTTYVLLSEGADIDKVHEATNALFERKAGPQLEQFLNISVDEFRDAGNYLEYNLMPLHRVHLYASEIMGSFEGKGDIRYVAIFIAIALFILIIACINFMNLSTARSASRAREVGVRKVLGSHRGQLIGQFLTESIMVAFVAFCLGILLAELGLPFFNDLSGKSIEIPYLSLGFFPTIVVMVVVVGVMAGMYPAFYLSRFKPVSVLKGQLSAGSGGSTLRSALVIFQFCVSIGLIIGTIVLQQQLAFIQNKQLGFDKEQVMIVHDTYMVPKAKLGSFEQELEQLAGVQSVSVSGFLPVENSNRNNTVFWPEGKISVADSQVLMQNWRVDEDYLETMGMELLEGRNFSKEFSTDSLALILNETAVERFGFKNPVGQRIGTFIDFTQDGQPVSENYHVIAVVKDFHFESMHAPVEPLCLMYGGSTGMISMRAKGTDIATLIPKVRTIWEEFAAGQPFSYSFLDQEFANMYEQEADMGKMVATFATLAILVACLGLFALAAYLAERRTKEIGIRKVLGASISQIMVLLSRDFLKLVLVAFFFATPIALYFLSQYLEEYAYRVDLWKVGPLAACIAAVVAIGIALVTVTSQSLRAAMANPAKALKDE